MEKRRIGGIIIIINESEREHDSSEDKQPNLTSPISRLQGETDKWTDLTPSKKAEARARQEREQSMMTASGSDRPRV